MPKAPRMAVDELKALGPILQRLYGDDATALRAASKMLSSLQQWVDAAHFYRHEKSGDEEIQPPLQLAIYLISSGIAHLRWLAEIETSLATAEAGAANAT
jgi:hypothetical protein